MGHGPSRRDDSGLLFRALFSIEVQKIVEKIIVTEYTVNVQQVACAGLERFTHQAVVSVVIAQDVAQFVHHCRQ